MTPVKGYIIVKIIQISIIFTPAVCGNDDDIPMKLDIRVLTNYHVEVDDNTYKVVRERRMVRLTSTTMST